MYRILNKIFGWDYIYVPHDEFPSVFRIKRNPDGIIYYERVTGEIFIIECFDEFLYLTCRKDKYFSLNEQLSYGIKLKD